MREVPLYGTWRWTPGEWCGASRIPPLGFGKTPAPISAPFCPTPFCAQELGRVHGFKSNCFTEPCSGSEEGSY